MTKKIFSSDIDIDFGNRKQILSLIPHHPACIIKDNTQTRHNTGVYCTAIPHNPVTGVSTLDYKQAQDRGYIKIDLLNVSVYNEIKDQAHLTKLLNTEPPWEKIYDREFCSQVLHIGNHYDTLIKMPEAVDSINKLAMFLAIIRPAKRHLIGLHWDKVEKTIWESATAGGYAYKKAHAISYSHLVAVHINLLANQETI